MKTNLPLRAIVFGLLGLLVAMLIVVVAALVLIPRADLLGQTTAAFAMIEKIYLLAGIPALILFGWLAARPLLQNHAAAGAAAGLVASLIDIATPIVNGMGTAGLTTAALTTGSKLLAGAVGGWLASRSTPTAVMPDPTI